MQRGDHLVLFPERDVLGDLDLKRVRRQPALIERGGHVVKQRFAMKLRREKIDADSHRPELGATPSGRVFAGRLQDPAPHFQNDQGFRPKRR